ncbi:MAG: bestrophin family protein [Myxococcales bacterium]|nr:bestrophin family protein [Myxococcales bacterium]
MLTRPKREFPTLLFKWRGSALSRIWPLLLLTFALSVALTWAHDQFDLVWMELSTAPFTILGIALSIFLGFRNNACYQRWWEGRILWGRLVNVSRSYSRQVLTLVGGDDPEVRVFQRALVYRMIAYVHALRLHLREQPRWEELGMFLAAAERQAIADERSKPTALLHLMGQRHRSALDRGWIDVFHLPILEESLTEITTIQGACERIKNTPVPLSYTELTHRIVALYVLFLPLGMLGSIDNLAPLAVMIIAFAFLGLDAVGSQIENPFEEDPNDLPLSQLSRMIENDLRTVLGEKDLRPDVTPNRGILL